LAAARNCAIAESHLQSTRSVFFRPGTLANCRVPTSTTSNPVLSNTSCGAIQYNIYRSLSATFTPFTQIVGAASSPFVPAIKVAVPAGGKLTYQDNNVVGGTTYYYRVAPATASDTETCQGNLSTLTIAIAKGR